VESREQPAGRPAGYLRPRHGNIRPAFEIMTALNDVTGHRHDRRVTTGVSRLSKISSRAPARLASPRLAAPRHAAPSPSSPVLPPPPLSLYVHGVVDPKIDVPAPAVGRT